MSTKWISPYLLGWDEPHSNFSSLLRAACPPDALPSPSCPRCEERSRAGVCPPPGTLADLLSLFPRCHVICIEGDCARHVGGYWPPQVKERMRALRVERINQGLSRVAGSWLASALGIAGAEEGARGGGRAVEPALAEPRGRVLALLGHLHAIELAARMKPLYLFLKATHTSFTSWGVNPTQHPSQHPTNSPIDTSRQSDRLESVVVIESDIRPVTRNAM
ncbi:MAG: hypothetical protein SGPRY_014571, partial [Prymnesium sp.]